MGEALCEVAKNGCEADWGLVVQTLSNCYIHWIVYKVDSVIRLLNKLNLTNCDQNVTMCSELHYRRDWSLPCCFGFGDTRTPRLIVIRYPNNPRNISSESQCSISQGLVRSAVLFSLWGLTEPLNWFHCFVVFRVARVVAPKKAALKEAEAELAVAMEVSFFYSCSQVFILFLTCYCADFPPELRKARVLKAVPSLRRKMVKCVASWYRDSKLYCLCSCFFAEPEQEAIRSSRGSGQTGSTTREIRS